MWMTMYQRHMAVEVCMRLLDEMLTFMLMLVMVTMHMRVVMFHLLMDMEVVMMFPKQEHDTHRHDQCGEHLAKSSSPTQAYLNS